MSPGGRALSGRIAWIAAAICLFSARVGWGACTYYGVDTLGTYFVTQDPQFVSMSQSQPVWSALAVRPAAGEDWDVALYRATAPEPGCVSSLVASSSLGGSVVDFVIGDYAYNPAGTYYASGDRFSGSGSGAVRWRQSHQIMTVNGAAEVRSWSVNDMIETWNVTLTAGIPYVISFGATAGLDATVLLFRNPGAAAYWAGRPAAELVATFTTTYTAPTTGTYGLVVVNDNGGTGTLSVSIGTCVAPTALASGTAIHTDLGYEYFQFTQSVAYWTAVGVRSTVSDYDVSVSSGTGGSWPTCFTGGLSSSVDVGKVDFVIGDFNVNPLGTYYAHAWNYGPPPGAEGEWDSGTQQLFVNGPPESRSSGVDDVLEVWDVFLSAGQVYNFAFAPSDPGLGLLLFRNTGGGVYWSRRSAAQFEATGCHTYAAPTSGYYGVVVVNDTGAPSSFTVGVSQSPCVCPVTLVSQVSTPAPAPDAYFRFEPYSNFWNVVATRGPTNADDWDLTVAGNATGAPAPTCFGNPLIQSAYGAGLVDIGVMDLNGLTASTTFAWTRRFNGASPTGRVQWDATHGDIYPSGPLQFETMPANDLAHVWDAWMESGQTYVLDYGPSDPTIKLLVFENAAGGGYHVTRGAAVVVTSTATNYTPTVTGYHGLVVVNDQAVNGNYRLRFGTCTAPLALAANVSDLASNGTNTFSFSQHANRWGAVGVRSMSTDWDLRVSATLGGVFPNCVGPSLASSISGSLPFVDFVVGDFFHNPAGTYYVDAYQFSAAPLISARVEWAEGSGSILVNDNNPVVATTGLNDVLQAWHVFLQAGLTYTFHFTHNGGADLHLLLFQNAGSTYWIGRSGAVADRPPTGTFTYSPPTSGNYGIVVANDDGAIDTYSLDIKTCFAPTALVSGVVTLDLPVNFHSFNQTVGYWTAVGVRSTSDWDIDVNANASGGPPGVCQSGLLASSNETSRVDLVVGDFNNIPTGTYYARPHRFFGNGIGSVEWDSGADILNVGVPPIHRNTDANDVLEVWDVLLTGGQSYGIYFSRSGTVDARVLLFRNPGGGYWAPRADRVYENTTHGNFTAPVTSYYGLVVVNDDGGVGGYDVGVTGSALAVDPEDAPHLTALRSVGPNPARAQLSVEYTLSERAPVHIQMLDLAGRVVADVEHQTRDAGVWRTGWNGRTTSGAAVAPGVYVVRLAVAGRAIGQRKVTVLE